VVVCATFNSDLAKEVGRVIGEEAAENGIQMILAPAMNIHRNPLCGRHAEYFSEDPYLAGKMAAGYVQGLHEAGISDSVKHFAANNCETARKRNHSLVGERALREIYLRAFEVLINSVKPDTIMTSYNALNGSMCGSDPILLEGILRDDFGFDGFVMTDWTSYDTVDMVEAVNAGISWLTPGENDGSRVTVLEKAVAEGRITRERLIENARRVFAVLIKRGV
jgi:beta-glucosidase